MRDRSPQPTTTNNTTQKCDRTLLKPVQALLNYDQELVQILTKLAEQVAQLESEGTLSQT